MERPVNRDLSRSAHSALNIHAVSTDGLEAISEETGLSETIRNRTASSAYRDVEDRLLVREGTPEFNAFRAITEAVAAAVDDTGGR